MALTCARVPGVVQVRFVVTEQGDVTGTTITSSSDSRFNAPTVRALQALKFSPARLDGRAVRVGADLAINWQVTGPDEPRLEVCGRL